MAGLDEVTQAAFQGAKPGPAVGTDVDQSTPLSPENVSSGPRPGANLILDALGATDRRKRAIERMNRRRAQYG